MTADDVLADEFRKAWQQGFAAAEEQMTMHYGLRSETVELVELADSRLTLPLYTIVGLIVLNVLLSCAVLWLLVTG